jgi:hypothetical protein
MLQTAGITVLKSSVTLQRLSAIGLLLETQYLTYGKVRILHFAERHLVFYFIKYLKNLLKFVSK